MYNLVELCRYYFFLRLDETTPPLMLRPRKTKKEKLIRDIVYFVVLVYVSVIVLLFANSQIKLANAQTEYVNSMISANQVLSMK